MIRKTSILLCCLFVLLNIKAQQHKREMRAAWIATVANIDWPSQRNLSSKAQREEMRAMLDGLAKNNINSIVYSHLKIIILQFKPHHVFCIFCVKHIQAKLA